MANGDITHVKELGRFTIPGGGHNLAGGAKNNKVMTWGEINGTWEDTNGLNLNNVGGRRALGLETLDYIQLYVKTVNAVYSGDEAIFTAALGEDSEEIYVVLDGTTNPTAGQICVLSYFAIGDDVSVADLT